MSKMLKSTSLMGAATLISRVLGLVREMVFAHLFGAGVVKGAFDIAYMVPNLFRRLLGEGALTAAFIPIFKGKLETEERQEVWRSANAVISGLVVVVSALIGLVLLGVGVAIGVGEFPEKTDLMLRLLMVLFPYVGFICVAAIFMGMLNAQGSFFVPALAPVLLNLIVIFSALFLIPGESEAKSHGVFVIAFAVLFAGFAQMAYMLPSLIKRGYRYRWVRPWGESVTKEVVQKMIPGTIGVAAFQINMMVTMLFAFAIGEGIVASFNYAVRLMEFPQGVFGVSLCTFMLPTLSGIAAKKEYGAFSKTLNRGLQFLIYVNFVVIGVTFVLAEPITRLILERGAFSVLDTANTSGALRYLAPSLIGYSFCGLLARAFYALGDVRTPMIISVVSLAVNLLIALLLVPPFKQNGLALANTLSSLGQAGLLMRALRIKLNGRWNPFEGLKPALVCAPIAAGAAGLVWLSSQWLAPLEIEWELGRRLIDVFGPMVVGVGVYALVTAWMPMEAPRALRAKILGRLARKGSH